MFFFTLRWNDINFQYTSVVMFDVQDYLHMFQKVGFIVSTNTGVCVYLDGNFFSTPKIPVKINK